MGPARQRASARAVLDAHWREPGFTCPNASTYPWLWLWDSCFHAIVRAELGDAERAVGELTTALGAQDASGFVPHLVYLDGSTDHVGFWDRAPVNGIASSSITQPPIYGLTIAELHRRGVTVADDVLGRATEGLRFLFDRRRRSPAGLIEIVHPWESGCDHSPRWDDLMSTGPYDEATWFDRKGTLLDTVHRGRHGEPLWNDRFAVGSVAFSAMTAFCALELAGVTGDGGLRAQGEEVVDALADRWEPGRRTWVDDGPTASGSGRIRTAEALLPLLVERRGEVVAAVVEELLDPTAFAGAFGPAQVHRDEPTFRRHSYWRGPSWPQLDHLLWTGLTRAGAGAAADELARRTVAGATTSGWAEYWDPDDGTPGGAVPQSWTTLAVCMTPDG